jgi:hypothetical protein
MTEKALAEGFVPLVLGGDHSIAIGSVSGVASHFRKQSKRIGLLWLDAHGDMNTPDSSPSGNVHGMPMAAVTGYGPPELVDLLGFHPKVEPRNVALVGIRDLDGRERRLMKESGVHVFTMRDVDERGMREVMSEAIRFASDDTDGVAVSLDMDFVDPTDAPGVGTPVRGGVNSAGFAFGFVWDLNPCHSERRNGAFCRATAKNMCDASESVHITARMVMRSHIFLGARPAPQSDSEGRRSKTLSPWKNPKSACASAYSLAAAPANTKSR